METPVEKNRGALLGFERSCDFLEAPDVVSLRVALKEAGKDVGLSSEVLSITDFAEFHHQIEVNGSANVGSASDIPVGAAAFELPNVTKYLELALDTEYLHKSFYKQESEGDYLLRLILTLHWALAPRAKTLNVPMNFFKQHWIGTSNRECAYVSAYILSHFKRVRLVLDDGIDRVINGEAFPGLFLTALPETVAESFKETHDSLQFVEGEGLKYSGHPRSTELKKDMLEELEVHFGSSDACSPCKSAVMSNVVSRLKHLIVIFVDGKARKMPCSFEHAKLQSLHIEAAEHYYSEVDVGKCFPKRLRKLTLRNCFLAEVPHLIMTDELHGRYPPPLEELSLCLSSSPIGLFGQDIVPFVAAFEGTLRRLTLALPHYRDMELQLTAPHLEYANFSGSLDLSVLVLRAPRLHSLLLDQCFSLRILEVESACLQSLDLQYCVNMEATDLSKCPASIDVIGRQEEEH